MAELLPSNLDELLNSWLATVEPSLAAWTRSVWGDMALEITPTIAGQMVTSKSIPDDLTDVWADQYQRWIDGALSKSLAEGMIKGASNLPEKAWRLLTPDNINEWVSIRGETLFQGLSSQQSKSLNRMINFFATEAPVSASTMANLIRPAVGLTELQSGTLLKHYQTLVKNGASADEIQLSVTSMTSKLQDVRAQRIARTELASAYNGGVDVAIRAAIDDDVFEGDIVKTWRTQDDERVCPICGPLDDTSVDVDDDFSSGAFTGPIPPAHPQCRCVVLYEEQE